MRRTLLVPAAGLGSRLQSNVPKVLTAIAGRPMIDYILERHAPYCGHVVVVLHPSAQEAVRVHLKGSRIPVSLATQTEPTGMLDAILCGQTAVLDSEPDRVWITWCDQVAISEKTVEKIAEHDAAAAAAAAVFPITIQRPPYIHFDRDARGTLASVRQRREGDVMPEEGESDAGLFSLSVEAFATDLTRYAREANRTGERTGERNFLPFFPWLARHARVVTFPIDAREAVGANTPDDVAILEQYLRHAGTPE